VWDSSLTFHKIREVLPKSRDTRGERVGVGRVGVSAVGTRSRAIRRCASDANVRSSASDGSCAPARPASRVQ
jgi:hypothetical protein